MSEIFTKIGGYIASGDPLVYADSATMTGDGTVASPFGVNKMDMFVQSPLFTGTSGEGDNTSAYIGWNNETVLWTQDGTFDGPGKTLTFAEPASAFEKLEFRCGVDIQNKECVTLEYHPGNAVISWHEFYSNQFRQFYSLLSIDDSGATAVSGCPYFANLANTATFTGQNVNWNWCFQAITAIYGVNRKPEA